MYLLTSPAPAVGHFTGQFLTMEKISVHSSLKDIPIPRRETFEKLFIAKLNFIDK